MTDGLRPLEETIASFKERALEYKAHHGSVEALVGPNHRFALAGLDRVEGIRIHVEEGITLMVDADNDIVVDGPLVYLHTDDHFVFGSKACIEDAPWDEDDDEAAQQWIGDHDG